HFCTCHARLMMAHGLSIPSARQLDTVLKMSSWRAEGIQFNRGEIALDKNRYIRGMFSKRRRPDGKFADPIIQVRAKAPFIGFTAYIMIGCGDHTHIYLERMPPSGIFVLAFPQ